MNRVHFSSTIDEWSTPQDLFDRLNKQWGPLELDVCATPSNSKCGLFYSKQENGLVQTWDKSKCWMNPPYGRKCALWVRKAYEESRLGALVVCLIPARTDTSWWHDFVMKGEVTFLRGRLKFSGAKYNAPFPSAVVIFKP